VICKSASILAGEGVSAHACDAALQMTGYGAAALDAAVLWGSGALSEV
jgi:hypothetical protein